MDDEAEFNKEFAEFEKRLARRRSSRLPPPEDDLALAYKLLAGLGGKDERGLPVNKYYRAGSRPELEARQALARILRDGGALDCNIRELLAGLIDPSPQLLQTLIARSGFHPGRQIRFARIKGATPNEQRQLKLGFEVWTEARKLGISRAVRLVADKYKMSDKPVWAAWKWFRQSPWGRAL